MEDWKIEYCKILSSQTVSNEDYKRALSIKQQHFPPVLYKYFSSPETALKVIESEQLLLNSPSTYNDPFECYEYIDDVLIIKEAIRLEMHAVINQFVEDKVITSQQGEFLRNSENPLNFMKAFIKSNELLNQLEFGLLELEESVKRSFRRKIDAFQSMTKMTCFSEANDNLLMWGHYAKNHEGVCIEFETNGWKADSVMEQIVFPVLYSETIYNATQHFIDHYKGQLINNHYNRISWISKCSDWKYEKEWRVIMVNDIYKNGYMLPVKNISAVYFGAKIKDLQRDSLIKVCGERSIRVYTGSISRKLYKVDFDPLNVA